MDHSDDSGAAGPEPDEPDTSAEHPESATAFGDSGSFFRERVAQSLAEQGYELKPDGTWGERTSPVDDSVHDGADDPVGPESHRSSEEPAEPTDVDDSAEVSGFAGSVGADGDVTPPPAWDADSEHRETVGGIEDDSVAEHPAERPAQSAAFEAPGARGADTEDGGAPGVADAVDESPVNDEVWDPEGTAAFRQVSGDPDDATDTHDASGAGDVPGPESTVPGSGMAPSAPMGPTTPPPSTAQPPGPPAPGAAAGDDPGMGSAAEPPGMGPVHAGPGGPQPPQPPQPPEPGGGPTPDPGATPDGADASTEAQSAMGAETGQVKRPVRARKSAKKGAGKPRKKRPLWWRITRAGLIGVGAFLLLGIVTFGIAYATIPVPDAAQQDATDQGSTFYYADGKTKFAERGVDREPVDYDDVPKEVQDAVIASEDQGFWTEPGVSVKGTVRAMWSTVTGEQVQGGSTITQQMVRNYYKGLSQEKTVTRKFKEIVISLKVDQSKSKKWVMEQYLNTIYFGRRAYGIQAASQAYFKKDMDELTPAESAFLAAAIQQPSRYGAADGKITKSMEGRWKAVLNHMAKEGSISKADAEQAEFPKPAKNQENDGKKLKGYKGYMLQQAMGEMEKLGYSEDVINRGGYKITTTFDKGMMRDAKDAVENTVDPGSLPDGVQVGMTAIDPKTGGVKAFYGGSDYNKSQYDSSSQGAAQAGSGFKPYVLAAALDSGDYGLDSTVDGSDKQVFDGHVLNNSHPGGGPLTLTKATAKSNNNAYANLAKEVGLDEVKQMAVAAGVPKDDITKEQAQQIRLALGVSSLSTADQASGYATFANGGEHSQKHVIDSIVDRNGDDQRPEVETSQAMDEDTAGDATYAMQQVVKGGTGRRAALPDGRPVAGKTGTTDNNVASWFNGFTPQLAASTSVYNGNNQSFTVPGWGSLEGGTLSATIWKNFMSEAMAGKDVKQFPSPSGSTGNYDQETQAQDDEAESTREESEEDENTQPPDEGTEGPPDEDTPGPGDPGPGDPGPGDPGPGDPGPGDPGPGDPGPGDPGPGDPGEGDDPGGPPAPPE